MPRIGSKGWDVGGGRWVSRLFVERGMPGVGQASYRSDKDQTFRAGCVWWGWEEVWAGKTLLKWDWPDLDSSLH